MELKSVLKLMQKIEKEIDKNLKAHQIIREDDQLYIMGINIDLIDEEYVAIKFKYCRETNGTHKEITLFNDKNTKLDYKFVSGYFAKILEDEEEL